MPAYLFKRLITIPISLFFILTAVFFLIRLTPGDPVDFILGENARVEEREQLIKDFHFDKPVSQQFGLYLKNMAQGNLGKSYFSDETAVEIIQKHYTPTVELALSAILWAVAFALPLGILSALKKGTATDQLTLTFSLVGISVPSFYLGPLLALLFSVYLDWFPLTGRELPGSLVLPSLTLGLAMAALLTRFTRASLLEVLDKDYIRTARAKGLQESKVILKHALRTTLIPIIAILGLQLGTLLAGAVVTEKIFSWPGIGFRLLQAISQRDYSIVQALVMLIATTYVIINLLTDLLYVVVDPRFELSKSGEA